MSDFLQTAGGSGYGVFPADVDVLVTNRSATSATASVGEVVSFCLFNNGSNVVASNGGPTATIYPGGVGSIFANVNKTWATQDRDCGIVGVMLQTVPYQGTGKCRVRGLVNVKVYNAANSAISIGSPITLPLTTTSTTGHFEAGSSTSPIGPVLAKIFGFTCASMAAATSTTDLQIPVVFDGLNGMGGLNS